MKSLILKKIDLDFAKVDIYENYLISQIKEGVIFEKQQLIQFYEIFELYYSGKPFVSIAERKYDYSINPNLLSESLFSNLLGIGEVCYSKASYKTALFEQKFFKGNFEPFYTIEECKKWAENLIVAYNKKAGL